MIDDLMGDVVGDFVGDLTGNVVVGDVVVGDVGAGGRLCVGHDLWWAIIFGRPVLYGGLVWRFCMAVFGRRFLVGGFS